MGGIRKPHLSLAQSAWLIVVVPALSGILFAVMLGSLSLDLERTIRHRAVIATKVNLINQLMQSLGWQMEACLGWHTVGKSVHKDELYELSETVVRLLNQLQKLAVDDPGLADTVAKSLPVAEDIVATNGVVRRSRHYGKLQAQKIISLHSPMQMALSRLYAGITSTDDETSHTNAQTAIALIVIGILVSSAISMLLFAIFSRRVAQRLSTLRENATDLAAGKPLGAKLSGADELNEVEDELILLSEELAIARERKQEFLSMIGHDLRSPLTSLQMTLEMYSGGVYGDLDDVVKVDVANHLKDVKQLVVFITDLLELEKLEAGSVVFSSAPVEISALLQSLKASLPPEISINSELFEIFDWDRPLQTFGDVDRLEMALNRIVITCLMDTPGPVRVRVSEMPEQSKILITVETRPGHQRRFSEETVFDRFEINKDKQILFRAYKHSLVLARELVRFQGGDIDVSHHPNSVRFNISLMRWQEGMS
jgi:signal transduction histidine kinase